MCNYFSCCLAPSHEFRRPGVEPGLRREYNHTPGYVALISGFFDLSDGSEPPTCR